MSKLIGRKVKLKIWVNNGVNRKGALAGEDIVRIYAVEERKPFSLRVERVSDGAKDGLTPSQVTYLNNKEVKL